MVKIPDWLYIDIPFLIIVGITSVAFHEIGHTVIPLLLGWENIEIVFLPPDGNFAITYYKIPSDVNLSIFFFIGMFGGLFQVLFLGFFALRPAGDVFAHWIMFPFIASFVYMLHETSWFFTRILASGMVDHFIQFVLPIILFIIWQEWKFRKGEFISVTVNVYRLWAFFFLFINSITMIIP